MPERGGNGDALLLAAGQLRQWPFHDLVQSEPAHEHIDTRPNVCGFGTEVLQGEGQLVNNRGGEELAPRVLQHRAGPPSELVKGALPDAEAGNRHPPRQCPLVEMRNETVHHPQESGLPRSTRPAQHDRLTRLDHEINALHRRLLRRRVLPGSLRDRDHMKPLAIQQAPARRPATATQSRSGHPSRGGTRLVGR